MSSPDSIHVATITRAACERVCHTRACSGRQMALYRSRAMATRLSVDTLTDTPSKGRGRGHLGNLYDTLTSVTSIPADGERPPTSGKDFRRGGGQGRQVSCSPTHEVGNRLADDCAKDKCAHEIGQEGEGHASHGQQEVADCQ